MKIVPFCPYAKKAINAGYSSNNGFEVEIQEFGNCFCLTAFTEGTIAFLQKRKANFKGQ
ncbi:MAG: hypothetical protein ACK5MZ_01735 [Aestuariibaculum sp.]